MTAAMSACTRSLMPVVRAASRLWIAAAATPFMKTLRNSFSLLGAALGRGRPRLPRHSEWPEQLGEVLGACSWRRAWASPVRSPG